MAYTIQQLQKDRVRPMHGRNGALDKDNFIVGPKGMRMAIEDVQTTAATSFANHGLTRILTTGSSQLSEYTLQAPVIGSIKRIVMHSSSTGCQLVRASGSALFYGASVSTAGSTVINFLKAGGDVTLVAMSSVAWRMMGAFTSLVSSDALGISFTTST